MCKYANFHCTETDVKTAHKSNHMKCLFWIDVVSSSSHIDA